MRFFRPSHWSNYNQSFECVSVGPLSEFHNLEMFLNFLLHLLQEYTKVQDAVSQSLEHITISPTLSFSNLNSEVEFSDKVSQIGCISPYSIQGMFLMRLVIKLVQSHIKIISKICFLLCQIKIKVQFDGKQTKISVNHKSLWLLISWNLTRSGIIT